MPPALRAPHPGAYWLGRLYAVLSTCIDECVRFGARLAQQAFGRRDEPPKAAVPTFTELDCTKIDSVETAALGGLTLVPTQWKGFPLQGKLSAEWLTDEVLSSPVFKFAKCGVYFGAYKKNQPGR
jgi:hypothetical protein